MKGFFSIPSTKSMENMYAHFMFKYTYFLGLTLSIIISSCKVQKSHGVDVTNDDPHWISALTTLHNTDTVITGSRDGFIRIWQVGEGFRSIKQIHRVEVGGFVNSLSISSCGKWIVAGIGQEHKLGRWWRDKTARNKVAFIKISHCESSVS